MVLGKSAEHHIAISARVSEIVGEKCYIDDVEVVPESCTAGVSVGIVEVVSENTFVYRPCRHGEPTGQPTTFTA